MDIDYRLLFKVESILILMLLYFGYYIRKHRSKHIKTMVTAIIFDILLVLQIELSRGAINQTINPNKNSLILNIHIFFAISTVILYFFMLYSGFKLKNNQLQHRKRHIFVGHTVLVLRTLNFLTSLFVT